MEKILIIDDSLVQAHSLKGILEPQYQVEVCVDSVMGVGRAEEIQPALILLDVVMPKLDGFEVLKALKESAVAGGVPVILITSLSDVGNEEKGLTLGAVDYIVKPFNAGIVRARVRTHTELYAYRRAADQLARVDGLTGIHNRRYADERGREEWFRAMRQGESISIGMLDIDHFKQYNDRYGHPAGDCALRAVAQSLTGVLRRASEFAARSGGEEFLFVMADDSAFQGAALAERIRRAVEALAIPHEGSATGRVLTVSVGGITHAPKIGDSLELWLERADKLLYQAKAGGRNRVVWDEGPGEEAQTADAAPPFVI